MRVRRSGAVSTGLLVCLLIIVVALIAVVASGLLDTGLAELVPQKRVKPVTVGMTTNEVRQAWGEPDEVKTTTTGQLTVAEWIYGKDSLHIVKGKVITIQVHSKR